MYLNTTNVIIQSNQKAILKLLKTNLNTTNVIIQFAMFVHAVVAAGKFKYY